MKTQFEFTLPRGLVLADGQVVRQGLMRLATAQDEIAAFSHPKVQQNEAYLPIVLLSRVVVGLGEGTAVTPETMANLFASDLAYLQEIYMRLNASENVLVNAVCPSCSSSFRLQVAPLYG